MPIDWIEIITLIIAGLAVGVLGGLLGIGGSIIMIPILTLLFRHDQHLSQAAAMIVNVCVSAPAVVRHQRARAIEWTVVRRMLLAGLIFILIGVACSNRLDGRKLMIVFGLFLIYVILVNTRKLFDNTDGDDNRDAHHDWTRASLVGAAMGFVAGLLGVGGGIVAVPLLQRICRLPLRHCIAVSATVMCVTAPLGAIRKNMALVQLSDLQRPVLVSLIIAACLAPTAIVGGFLGATLTHRLPLKAVRAALIILLTLASAKYLGIL